MKLKKLIAKNFLTYEELDYNFVDKPLMIQGLNLTDDKQKSNGSGKSSIQAMIEFSITGDNSRGVRDIELIRFGCKEAFLDLFAVCNVRKEEIHINWKIKVKGSNVLQITRKRENDNWEEVSFSNVNDGKKWILQWFAISKEDLFNYFIINKTRFKSFFKSSNREKVELINRFSDASIIDGIEEVDTFELDDKYQKLNNDILKTDGKIEVLNENIETQLSRDIEAEFEEQVNKIKGDNEEILEEIEEINSDIENEEQKILDTKSDILKLEQNNTLEEQNKLPLSNQIEKIEESFKEINSKLKIAQNEVNNFKDTDFNSEREKFELKIDDIKKDIELKEQSVSKLKNNEEDVLKILSNISIILSGTITCPSCSYKFLKDSETPLEKIKEKEKGANTLKKTILKEKETLLNEIKLLNSSLKEPKDLISDVDKKEKLEKLNKGKLIEKVNEVNSLISKKNSELNILKSNLQNIVDNINSNKTLINNKLNLINNFKQNIKGFESEISNFEKEIEANNNLLNSLKKSDNKKEIKEIGKKIETLKKEKINLEKDYKILGDEIYKINQWKNNFKQFKMYVANKSLETMEFHCNRYLKGMGSDLKVVFEGYKVLANGTIKDEITAKIIRNEERTFNSFSGGERARLLFSSILANRHMINMTHPYGGFSYLSIDECLEGLDSLGIQSIINESKKLQECMHIITHITDENVSEDILRVVKRNGISKIE